MMNAKVVTKTTSIRVAKTGHGSRRRSPARYAICRMSIGGSKLPTSLPSVGGSDFTGFRVDKSNRLVVSASRTVQHLGYEAMLAVAKSLDTTGRVARLRRGNTTLPVQ